MFRRVPLILLGFASVGLALGLLPDPGKTVAILLPSDGVPPDNASGNPVIASSGRVVAFLSRATNLIAGDTDSVRDVVVVDLAKGSSECVSVSSAGVKADGDCSDIALDRKGRTVAFASLATNLVENDGNGMQDVFVRDRTTGETLRVSVTSDGNEADGDSDHPALTCDGRRVVFASYATNLAPQDTNDASDIFLHDLQTGETTRISVAFNGAQAGGGSFLPEISANGRFVAFMSYAGNIVPNDQNPSRDVFVRDLKTGQAEIVSVSSEGDAPHAPSGAVAMSANGRWLAFESDAGSLDGDDLWAGADVFLRDRKLGTTTLISRPAPGKLTTGDSFSPAISGNGRWALFTSVSTKVVADDDNGVADVFRCDLKTGKTTRVSVSSEGAEGDGDSVEGRISRNGRYVVFSTRADDLVAGTTNGVPVVVLARP